MPDPTDNFMYESQISQGRNKRRIKCRYCRSIILAPSSATFETLEFQLPLIKQSKLDSQAEPETENIGHFWVVNDMYTFENISFTQTVDSKKYLGCADCEAGPIGFYDISTKISYVAFSRVDYI